MERVSAELKECHKTAKKWRLEAEAVAAGAQLVTTEKDAARLPAHWRPKVLTLVVRLKIDDWSALDAQIVRLGL